MKRIPMLVSLSCALFLLSLSLLFPLKMQAMGQTTYTADMIVPPSNSTTTYTDNSGITVNYVARGWTIINQNNTDTESELAALGGRAVVLCPPGSGEIETENVISYNCAAGSNGQVEITHYPAMDKNDYFVEHATVRDPQTGLFTLNLSAWNILDYTKSP